MSEVALVKSSRLLNLPPEFYNKPLTAEAEILVVLAFPPWSAGKSDKSNTPFKCVTQVYTDFRLAEEAVCRQRQSQYACTKWHWCYCQLTWAAQLKMILVLPSLGGQFQKLIVLLPRKCYLRGPATPDFIWSRGASEPLNIKLTMSQAERPKSVAI